MNLSVLFVLVAVIVACHADVNKGIFHHGNLFSVNVPDVEFEVEAVIEKLNQCMADLEKTRIDDLPTDFTIGINQDNDLNTLKIRLRRCEIELEQARAPDLPDYALSRNKRRLDSGNLNGLHFNSNNK